ncbi:MAG: DUF4276 family protein [Syntrophobacteraceae bacterium]
MNARLMIHVEGQTEETFVNEILRPHLYIFGYTRIGARLLGNARQRRRRGGIRSWNAVRHDILTHLKEDTGCLATTMVDYYGLPAVGPKAWPGRETAGGLLSAEKASAVEKALCEDIEREMGRGNQRFKGYASLEACRGFGSKLHQAITGGLAILQIGLDPIREQALILQSGLSVLKPGLWRFVISRSGNMIEML